MPTKDVIFIKPHSRVNKGWQVLWSRVNESFGRVLQRTCDFRDCHNKEQQVRLGRNFKFCKNNVIQKYLFRWIITSALFLMFSRNGASYAYKTNMIKKPDNTHLFQELLWSKMLKRWPISFAVPKPFQPWVLSTIKIRYDVFGPTVQGSAARCPYPF